MPEQHRHLATKCERYCQPAGGGGIILCRHAHSLFIYTALQQSALRSVDKVVRWVVEWS